MSWDGWLVIACSMIAPGAAYFLGYRFGWKDAEQKTRLEWLELFQERQDRNSP